MSSEADRFKRLRIRSWRRGTREMDLILGRFCDTEIARLSETELALYEEMLSENDHELYAWVSGMSTPPERFATLVARVSRHARASA